MSHATSIIDEVESALHGATDAKRGDVLRRVTDLFIGGAEKINPEQTALFDGVMVQLISHIESRAVVELSRRLAPLANAPLDTVQTLARHDDIEIAGPILSGSERLTDDDLIEIVNSKSNKHLASISGRAHLKETVTDILVERGDAEVADGLASNSGARFSQIGMAKLVMRAESDDRLTESVARRADVPPRLFRQLLAQATEVVRNKLLTSAAPDRQNAIKNVLAEISAQVAPQPVATQHRAEAQRLMNRFGQDTVLLQSKILEFAGLKRIADVIAGLSILSGVPFEQIDRLFCASNGFGLMVLCKTLALDWPAAQLIIFASQVDEQQQDLCNQYNALSIPSAQRLFRFWQARQKVAQHFKDASGAAALHGATLKVG
jgi:Uncharacterised protein conserved in bacteria (DUF2336)